MLAPFECLCGNFILPEPASYVFFYAVFNLRKLFYLIRAAAELAKNGFTLDESTAKYKGEKMVAVYLKQEFGGFAVHLLQK